MKSAVKPLTERQAWNALAAHHQSVRELHLRKLFADDPTRGERMTAEAVGIYLDYSKNRITDETLKLLLQLANESGLRERMDAMFRGEKINDPRRCHGRALRAQSFDGASDRAVAADGYPDCIIGMKTFGASAPLKELQRHFAFEPDRVAAAAKELLSK